MKRSIKYWFVKVFARDIDLKRKVFLYLLFSFLPIVLIVEYFILKYFVYMKYSLDREIPAIIILFIFSFIFLASGFLVDVIKNKTRLLIISLLFCIIGLCLSLHPSPIIDFFSILLIFITIPPLILVWLSTLVHETNILNRARVTAMFLIAGFLFGLLGLVFIFFEEIFIFFIILEFILLIIIAWHSRIYKYIETEERLKSDKKYLKVIFEKHLSRYTIGFALLSGLIGGLFYNTLEYFWNYGGGYEINIITFSLISISYVMAAGWFFDNVGRKSTLVIGILVVSFFYISHISFYQAPIEYIFGIPIRTHISIHYALAVLPLILAIITISGDFSTERGNVKYRGSINGLFLALLCFGLAVGYLFYRTIDCLYNTEPNMSTIVPGLPSLLNSFAIVIILVWMMASKDILISKERDWASSVKRLYILNYHGVCLYHQYFELKDKSMEEKDNGYIDEDLVSGTLSGIITIVSEITKSKKHLRKIEKENNHFYFSYGKHHIATLISTTELPVLLKKLDEFSGEFEQMFTEDLKNFKGNVSRFKTAKYIVKKYFKQKYV